MENLILVLEDDPNLLRMHHEALLKAGYLVHFASTLEEAHQRLCENDYAVFICDMSIGNSSSLLRQEWAKLKQTGTRVIIVSGHEQYRSLTTDMDVNFSLSKPISVHDLTHYISRINGT